MSNRTRLRMQKVPQAQGPDAPPHFCDELLDAYSSWLFFERHFLHVKRFGVERAMELIDTVMTDNVGAALHLPIDQDLPDYSAPSRRAAAVLTAAGLEAERLGQLAVPTRAIPPPFPDLAVTG
jgi:hypothetical protein